jgi:phage-related protein
MVSLADAYVRIRPDTSGLDADGIAKPASAMGKKAGEEAGKAFGISFSSLLKSAGVAAAGLATGQIAGFFKSTIEAASNVSEAQNKVAVVFGKSTQSVLDFGKQSATSMGLSKASYLDAVGTLGNLFVALKLPGPEAAKMSTNMVKLAGDLASFNNTSPEDALEALRSGLVGETEPLRQYGVNINAATLQTEAMKLGLIDNIKTALTPAQKAQATYALVLDQTKTAQGDFTRTSGGLANQQRILKAQFDDLKSTIGAALLPAFTSLVHIVTERVVPGIKEFISGLQGKNELSEFPSRLNVAGRGVWAFFQAFKDGQVISHGFVGQMEEIGVAARRVVDDIRGIVTVLVNNKDAIIAFVATLGTLKLIIEGVTLAMRAWAIASAVISFVQLAAGVRSFADAWALLDVAMDANPIGIVVIAIAALVAGLVLAWQHSETFRNVVTTAFDAVKGVVLFLWHSVFEPWWQGLVTIFNNIVAGAQQWYAGLQSAFTNVSNAVSAVGNFFQSLWNGIVAVFNGIIGTAHAWYAGLQVVFSAIGAAVQVLAAPFLWLWHTIFEPVFNALAFIVKAWYTIWYDIVLLAIKVIQQDFTLALHAFQALWSTIWNGITAVAKQWWAGVQALWQAAVNFLGGPLSAANNAMHALWTSVWNAIVSVATSTWNGIRNIWNAIVSFLSGPLTSANNAFHSLYQTVWNAIAGVAETIWNKIRGFWQTMSDWVTKTLPDAFRNGVAAISNFWNGLQDKVKAPINFVIGFINRGIINPINDLVGTFGGSKLATIPGLAGGGLIRGPGTGTSDSILGLSAGGVPTARVSDGEFVVNAAQTARHYDLLRAINTPGFATGGLIGGITSGISDMLGALTNPIKWLLDKAGDVGALISQMGGTGFAQMLGGIPRKLIDWAGAWLKDKLTSAIDISGVSGNLAGWITAAMQITGVPASWFGPLTVLIGRESGGNPNAINLTDSNAAAGHPSQGLMQTIPSTFEAYRDPRLPDVITNPIANIVAGINYILSRYGSIFNVQQANPSLPPKGYANGGVIGEPIWGVGKSGRRYTFGENGPETVTPGVGGLGGGLNLTINVSGDVGDKQVAAIRAHVDDAFGKLLMQMKTGRRR